MPGRRGDAAEATHTGTVWLPVRVIPRARRTELRGSRDGQPVVAVAALPADGKANAALVTFIAKQLRVPKRAVTIERGQKSRQKVLRIEGVDRETVGSVFGLER